MWRLWWLFWVCPKWVHETVVALTGKRLGRGRCPTCGAVLKFIWQDVREEGRP
jgi:hypothetical protein